MKLILFVDSLRTGGAQRQILSVASGLTDCGYDVLLLTVFPSGQFWDEAFERQEFRLGSLFSACAKTKLGRVVGFLSAPIRLRRVLENTEPDMLYSMLDVSNLIARLATIKFGTHRCCPTLVWGIRASHLQSGARAAVTQGLCRWLSGSVPFTIANSEKGLDVYRESGFRIRDARVIYNGIDIDLFHFDADGRKASRKTWGVLDDEILIGLVGRLDPQKGHEKFLYMASLLVKQDTKMKFVCIGVGSNDKVDKLIELAEKLGLGELFIVVESESDMKIAYSGLDILVSASVSEGFPNVVGEAMACERACVVTDVGDTAMLVGDCGIIVAADDQQGLADAVLCAISQRNEMGKRGRERISMDFSIETMIDRTKCALEAAVIQ